MELEIEKSSPGGVQVLRLSGQLTGGENDPLVLTVTELLAEPKPKIVLDFAGVSHVNSAGLGELVRLVAQANVQGGRIILAHLPPYVAGVLEMTRLDRFFEIAADPEEAQKRMA